MKKYLLGLLLFMPGLASAQSAIPFTLKGTIGQLEPPAKIFLLLDGEFTNSVTLHHGAFELTGTMDTPKPVMLILMRSGRLGEAFGGSGGVDRTFIFLDKGTTVLTSPDSLKNAKPTGTKLAAEDEKVKAQLKLMYAKRRALLAQHPTPGAQESPEFKRRLEALDATLTQERHQLYTAHIKANPNSYVSLHLLKDMGGFIPQYAETGPLYDALTPAVRNSPDGRKYGELLQVIKAAGSGTQTPNAEAVELAVTKYEEAQGQIRTKEHEQQLRERNQRLAAYISAHPDQYASLDAVEQIGGPVPTFTEVSPLYNALSPAIRNTPEGRAYGERLKLLQGTSAGAPASNFTLKTPDGREVSLTDYRGKYVLVDFWASWCGPCRAESPNLAKAYNEYKNRNFDILGISIDGEQARDKWLKAIRDDQLAWTQVLDQPAGENTVATRYHVQAIPQNLLIDPSGKIIATNLRGDDLRAVLAQHIK